MSKQFIRDLTSGKEIEAKIINYFESRGMKLLDWNDTDEYDFLMQYKNHKLTFEVKADFYDTDNMIFEFEYKGSPSGIATTKAEWFIYYFHKTNQIWIIKTSKLQYLCKFAPEEIECGEDAKAYKFSKYEIMTNFKIRKL